MLYQSHISPTGQFSVELASGVYAPALGNEDTFMEVYPRVVESYLTVFSDAAVNSGESCGCCVVIVVVVGGGDVVLVVMTMGTTSAFPSTLMITYNNI